MPVIKPCDFCPSMPTHLDTAPFSPLQKLPQTLFLLQISHAGVQLDIAMATEFVLLLPSPTPSPR